MRQFSKMLLAFLWVPFISCSDDEIGGNIEPSDEQLSATHMSAQSADIATTFDR